MTGFELIRENKRKYEEQIKKNETLQGLSKLVGETLMLSWIKGNNWMGGLSDSKAQKLYNKLMSYGYSFDEIDNEFEKQKDEILPINETYIASKNQTLNDSLTQYYGINKDGNATFVAMTKDKVKEWAKKHPEDNIVLIQDSNNREYELNESLTLREALSYFDSKEFRDNSTSYELESLYESVKNTLSAQQKNDLAKFVRKARTADEINTYMTGMMVKDNINEDYYDDIGITENDIQKLNKIRDDLEIYLNNNCDVWIEDIWTSDDNKIVVYVHNGDWKHDHLRLDYALREWLENNDYDADVYTQEEESDSDIYSAYHIIRFRNLDNDVNEGYISAKQEEESKEERFSNGELKDFDPYPFINKVMKTGQSLHTIKTVGNDYYTFFVQYENFFGPKGTDDLDTRYELDVIKEDARGDQERIFLARDLLWHEVAETILSLKEQILL